MLSLFRKFINPSKGSSSRAPVRRSSVEDKRAHAGASRASSIKKHLGLALNDTMVLAGILSSEYTFKVLTTVGDHSKHILVVNLQRPLPGGQEQQAAAETLISLLAMTKHELKVSAVYWRVVSLVEANGAHRAPLALATATAAVRAASPKAVLPTHLPLEKRRPVFYDDAPGYQEPDFVRTRPADSDLMGLYA